MATNTVWRLLRRNISAGQIAGYALASFVGLAIVLTALQFYRDVTSVWEAEDSFISEDYIVISKKVPEGGMLFGSSSEATRFSREEIADLREQPWVNKVGEFESAGFNVYAKVEMGGSTMGTALFLESIPDEFFDIRPQGWDYTPGVSDYLPIVLSKDYLSLYNFGFATSHGMPQLSEELIGMVPLKLSLSGNGRQEWVDARIVGFSSRLNTIAVPREFLSAANSQFAETPAETPSRLIVKLERPGDPQAETYLREHGYETAGDRSANGKTAYFLSVVTSIVVGVGLLISVLAFFILMLSIYLLLQKNREKTRTLLLLGYSPSQVASHYYSIVVTVNVAVLVCATALMIMGASLWRRPLSALGVDPTSVWPTVAVGVILVSLITAGNLLAIHRGISKEF